MIKIRIIKDTEKCKVGEVVETSKKSAESYVNEGYAEYVETESPKKVKYIKVRLLKDIEGWGKKGEIANIKESESKEEIEIGSIEIVKEERTKEIKQQEKILLPDEETIRSNLYETYELIKEVISEYTDIDSIYLPIVALWIIGTYMHDGFESYPYLFINAMRGSGKTRLLKLVAAMAHKGEVINNISEAVLFRGVKGGTVLLDEFEGIGKKESSTLRELLNSAYKKGAKVKRMRKKKTLDGEEYVTEKFDIYFPIGMANIWGMEEVLGDRCLTVFLEKSNKPEIVKLIENYTENDKIIRILSNLSFVQCSLCSVVTKKNVYNCWNNFIKDKYITNNNTTLTTHTTYTTLHYTNYIDFFNKIDSSKINGRNLEISFPLFLIGSFIGDDILKEILISLEKIINEKNDEEKVESQDVSFLRFLGSKDYSKEIGVSELTSDFIEFIGELDVDEKWISSKWVGRALRRLRLIKGKRRSSKGIYVLIDTIKSKEKLQQYE